MIRLFLIVSLLLSASLSGAVANGHMVVPDHNHSVVESVDNDLLTCCDAGTERAQICLTMPAMFEGTGMAGDAQASRDTIFDARGFLLTGIQLSGPLDPPRMV